MEPSGRSDIQLWKIRLEVSQQCFDNLINGRYCSSTYPREILAIYVNFELDSVCLLYENSDDRLVSHAIPKSQVDDRPTSTHDNKTNKQKKIGPLKLLNKMIVQPPLHSRSRQKRRNKQTDKQINKETEIGHVSGHQ